MLYFAHPYPLQYPRRREGAILQAVRVLGGGGLLWAPRAQLFQGGPWRCPGLCPPQGLGDFAALVSFLCTCLSVCPSSLPALGTSPSTSPGVLTALPRSLAPMAVPSPQPGTPPRGLSHGCSQRAGSPARPLLPTLQGKATCSPSWTAPCRTSTTCTCCWRRRRSRRCAGP